MSVGDPYFDFVSCLMHFDGPNNGLRIYDERHNAVRVAGNAKLTTGQSKFGGSSLDLDGIGDYVHMPGSSAFAFGNGDFTVEAQIRTSVGNKTLIDRYSSSDPTTYQLFINSSGLLVWYAGNALLTASAGDVRGTDWKHVAVSRESGTLRMFVDGVLVGSTSDSSNYSNATTVCAIGAQHTIRNASYDFKGQIDELRITKGIARYTANFTPPTAPFPNYGSSGPRTDPDYDKVVLHCHFDGEPGSTTFVDQKGHTLTPLSSGASPALTSVGAKFGGTAVAGSISIQSGVQSISADYNIGAQDFTIEFFASAHSTGTSGQRRVFALYSNNRSFVVLGLMSSVSDQRAALIVNGTISSYVVGPMNPAHVAVVRNGPEIRLYTGGTLRQTVSVGTDALSSNGELWILGEQGVSTSHVAIDEFRFTKGLARYTTSFTPPTEPFPDYALQKLTGTVLDDEGNPLARTVRSFRSSDGLLIDTQESDPVTGAFELRATDITPHFVVVQDPEKNALIYDHIIPVI